jgi:hypothetical protein
MSDKESTLKLSDLIAGFDTEKSSIKKDPTETKTDIIKEIDTMAETKKEKVTKAKEEVTPKAPKAPKVVPVIPGMTDIYTYVESHKEKIRNAKPIQLSLSNVPVGKHLLYVTNETADASVIKIDAPDKLQVLNPDSPAAIDVYNSGLAIDCSKQRIYVLKTNTVVFDLNKKGIPISMSTISKKGTKDPVETVAPGNKYKTLEQLKLILKKEAITLYNQVKDKEKIDEVITDIQAFRATRTDVLYQIKLDQIIMDIER